MNYIKAFILTAVVFCFSSLKAYALTENQAKEYIQKVSGALELILNETREKEVIYKDFENLFSTYGDVPIITRYLIGPPSREMSKSQMKKAELEIRRYLAVKYGKQFEKYIGAQISIRNLSSKKNSATVETNFVSPNQNFIVSWVVSDKSGEIKLVDIIIEGVSMLRIEREEIGARLEKARFDVNILLEELN